MTKDTLRTFIATNFFVPEGTTIDDDTSLLDIGIIDSTGVLEVTAFLEGEYGIKVYDGEIVPANMDSLNAIANFVSRKCACAA